MFGFTMSIRTKTIPSYETCLPSDLKVVAEVDEGGSVTLADNDMSLSPVI